MITLTDTDAVPMFVGLITAGMVLGTGQTTGARVLDVTPGTPESTGAGTVTLVTTAGPRTYCYGDQVAVLDR